MQIADLTVLGKSYFRIIWDQWRVELLSEFRDHYICCDPDTGGIRAEKRMYFQEKRYKMNFERVKREEADTVLKLYRSLLGTPYCVWTEEYPSEKEVEFDLSRDALFCMRDDAGNIVGVISIDDDPNVECLTCWSETMVPSAEVSRVGVCQEFQNQGIAGKLLKGVMEELKKRGYKAVHLLVAKDNVKALRSYDKLNFENVGECELWGHMYWCYEKAL